MVLNRLGTRPRTLLKIAGQGVGIFLFGLLTKLTVPMAIYSYEISEYTGGSVPIPMYPAKIMIPVATGLITIQLVLELIKSVRVLLSRNGDDGSLTAS
jgi:TRAP-type mannitol/chloroaromatic compound transport system permease small subunit